MPRQVQAEAPLRIDRSEQGGVNALLPLVVGVVVLASLISLARTGEEKTSRTGVTVEQPGGSAEEATPTTEASTTTTSTTTPEKARSQVFTGSFFSVQAPTDWNESKPHYNFGGVSHRYENEATGYFVEVVYDSGTEFGADRVLYYTAGPNGDTISLVTVKDKDGKEKYKQYDCTSGDEGCLKGDGKLEIGVKPDDSNSGLQIMGHNVFFYIGNDKVEAAGTQDILDVVKSFRATSSQV